jgi:GNAT-family acetyltransferase (TIGR03103 family)
VPAGRIAEDNDGDVDFVTEHQRVVVKPVRGEQGRGITVGVQDADHLKRAVEHAQRFDSRVLLEAMVQGQDLRIIVIDHEVVAAAVRRPAQVRGTGSHTIAELIDKQSRRRSSSTGGEAKIPLDNNTRDTLADAGYDLDDVLEKDKGLQVRGTANLHTGGTIHDVTADLHPELTRAAVSASRVLDIPVVGLDFIAPAVDGPEYVCIEANERPGLANHEPQPTAEKFIDLLFPQTRSRQLA